MISLQIHIRNLSVASAALGPLVDPQTVTLRFGPLQADILIQGDLLCGGKRIILNLERQEVEKYLATFALGLFIQNTQGRFWCILSLQHLEIGEGHSCPDALFYNDEKKACYSFYFFARLSEHHPKCPKIPEKQVEDSVKKSKVKVGTFLYGKKHMKAQQSTTMARHPSHPIAEKPLMQKNQRVYEGEPIQQDDGQLSVYTPPIMQFTNNDASQSQNQAQLHHAPTNHHVFGFEKQPEFREPFQGHSNQKIHKSTKKENQMKRNQLRELAKKEAQQSMAKKQNEIMVPVPNPKTGVYELRPLSTMTQDQIMEYAHKQRLADQFKQAQLRRKLRKEKNKQNKLDKQLHVGKLEKQSRKQLLKHNLGVGKAGQKEHISEKMKESSSDSESDGSQEKDQPIINQPSHHQSDEDDDENYDEGEYESDFQSISNVGSQLKSRISLQSSMSMSQEKEKEKKKINQSDMSESMNDYEYSQDFDSFSQSLASKNKRGSSISEISGSYASLSNRKF